MRTLEELLLQLGLGDLDLDRLVNLLLVPALMVRVVLDGGGEERVDEGRLAQPGLARNLTGGQQELQPRETSHPDHDGEGGTPLRDNLVPLVGQIGDANRRGALSSGRSHLELMFDRNGSKTDEGIRNLLPKPQACVIGRDVAEVERRWVGVRR